MIQPRVEEIFRRLWDEIRNDGYERSLHSGIVLAGGCGMLDGILEVAGQMFDLQIRRGHPVGVGGLSDHVNNPAFATAVGLVLHAHRKQRAEREQVVGVGAFGRAAVRIRGLFKEFF